MWRPEPGAIRAVAPRSVWSGSGMWRPEPGLSLVRAMMPRFGSGACMRVCCGCARRTDFAGSPRALPRA
eukprot:4608436-Prymnesium_polylepis.1